MRMQCIRMGENQYRVEVGILSKIIGAPNRVEATQQFRTKVFLEWMNDWLTVKRMAEHYQMDFMVMHDLVEEGKFLHNERAGK